MARGVPRTQLAGRPPVTSASAVPVGYLPLFSPSSACELRKVCGISRLPLVSLGFRGDGGCWGEGGVGVLASCVRWGRIPLMSGERSVPPCPIPKVTHPYECQDEPAGRGGLQCVRRCRVVRGCFELLVRCPKAGAGARLLTGVYITCGKRDTALIRPPQI